MADHPPEIEAQIRTLCKQGRELRNKWTLMMADSRDPIKDNQRVARACDSFFVASYWCENGDPEFGIELMEDGIRHLESVIQQGVT